MMAAPTCCVLDVPPRSAVRISPCVEDGVDGALHAFRGGELAQVAEHHRA